MKKKVFFALLALVLCLMLASCEPEQTSQKANLVVQLKDEVSKTIMPKQNQLSVTRYSIEGSGPGGISFAPVYGDTAQLSVSELAPGSWTLTARAYNAEGKNLAQGSTNCTLARGPNNVSVVLNSIPGAGSVQIAFSWEDTISSSSTIKITTTFELEGGGKTVNEKTVSTSDKKTTITQTLTAGSYVMRVEVSDSSGKIGIGAAEALRVVDNTQSIGVVKLASTGAGMVVSLENQVSNPMQIYLDYSPKAPVAGESIKLIAKYDELPSYVTSSDLRFQWYKNGVLQSVGSSSLTLKAEAGVHRYDVIVSNSRKGSTSSATLTLSL